jgi:prevent-host-death family protein
MATIPQKELRNNVAEVLRRAEAGEEFTITVSGRPVAQLGPTRTRRWVPGAQLADLWKAPADPTLEKDLGTLGGELTDPWAP